MKQIVIASTNKGKIKEFKEMLEPEGYEVLCLSDLPDYKEVEETGMIKELEGYSVLGKVKIENLGIDTYILDSVEADALKLASGKLIGNELNEEGNFCIIGHNYDDIFLKLLEIEKSEEIIIVDRDENETKYKVVDVKTIEPDELDVLLDVDGKTQITLITCENTASTRLVVVAEMIEETTIENEVEK